MFLYLLAFIILYLAYIYFKEQHYIDYSDMMNEKPLDIKIFPYNEKINI